MSTCSLLRTSAVTMLVVLVDASRAFADVEACLSAAEQGQRLRAAGSLTSAQASFAKCIPQACPRDVRVDCSRWLSEVDEAIPTIVVQAKDSEGHDRVDVRVSVDGALLAQTLTGLALPLDPGSRRLRFEAKDAPPVEQVLAIRQSEKNRIVSVVFEHPRPATPNAPVIPFVVGGAGLVAVGFGVGLWAIGLRDRSDLRDACASPTSCNQNDIDAAKTKLVVGDILVGIGVVALATGIYLAVRPRAEHTSSRAPGFVITF